MRSSRVRRLAMIATASAVVTVIAVIRYVAASTTSSPPPDTGSTGSQVQPSPTTQYWSPERMRNAKPAEMPPP
ncbi:hypothetical protein [Actinoallomurus acanthiterrae]